jgi:hypothetical protein
MPAGPWPTRGYPAATRRVNLERQEPVVELYCARQGRTFEVASDLGSGMSKEKVEARVGRLLALA